MPITSTAELTEERLQRWEAKRRQTSASGGQERGPPSTEPTGYYTKVPNWLFDLPERKNLDAPSAVALFQIARLTYGMHSPTLSAVISVEQLAVRCNFSAATCRRALRRLEEAGLIRRENRVDKNGTQMPNAIYLLGTE